MTTADEKWLRLAEVIFVITHKRGFWPFVRRLTHMCLCKLEDSGCRIRHLYSNGKQVWFRD